MTTFLLVPGLWMGGWAWDAVAEELTARGHRAVPVTLPGLEPEAGPAAGQVRLADHVAAVAAVANREGPVVLVAHSYGSYPAIGAADLRPELVERIVLVDTGTPEDGESLATSFAGAHLPPATAGGLLPVPAELTGVTGELLAHYHRHARPQPAGTVTDPVTLTGAWAAVPTTGVFCLENGLSIEVARSLHATGAPRFAKLAAPTTTYFELPTGHFPMLTTPALLAETLTRAAAGEGAPLHS
ncbi:alpha/beta hydrolase [Kitasatospora sp. NPDC002227]|uniref:alpha/beta fold hydrolase n=1 Tax=Kitasatospora sp. NPDC002227 TaxID=3154773 RepID=UPI00331A2891